MSESSNDTVLFIGSANSMRYHKLKLKMGFSSDIYFVRWLLDIADSAAIVMEAHANRLKEEEEEESSFSLANMKHNVSDLGSHSVESMNTHTDSDNGIDDNHYESNDIFDNDFESTIKNRVDERDQRDAIGQSNMLGEEVSNDECNVGEVDSSNFTDNRMGQIEDTAEENCHAITGQLLTVQQDDVRQKGTDHELINSSAISYGVLRSAPIKCEQSGTSREQPPPPPQPSAPRPLTSSPGRHNPAAMAPAAASCSVTTSSTLASLERVVSRLRAPPSPQRPAAAASLYRPRVALASQRFLNAPPPPPPPGPVLQGRGSDGIMPMALDGYVRDPSVCAAMLTAAAADRAATVTSGQYVCNVCGKGFPHVQRLRMHMKVHSGDKPFSCQICGKKFADKGNMRRHVYLHSGIKPYSCTFCGARFTLKHNMKTHVVSVHGQNI